MADEKGKAIRSLMNRATVLVVVVYLIIWLIDAAYHPKYTAVLVGALAIVAMLVGIGVGFNTAFRIKFSTVMQHTSNGQMVKEIQKSSPPTVAKKHKSGIDDDE